VQRSLTDERLIKYLNPVRLKNKLLKKLGFRKRTRRKKKRDRRNENLYLKGEEWRGCAEKKEKTRKQGMLYSEFV